MLTSIPLISPIEVSFGSPDSQRLLAAPLNPEPGESDYTVETGPIDAPVVQAVVDETAWQALKSLEDIERVVKVIAYPEAEWWQTRLVAIRAQVERKD